MFYMLHFLDWCPSVTFIRCQHLLIHGYTQTANILPFTHRWVDTTTSSAIDPNMLNISTSLLTWWNTGGWKHSNSSPYLSIKDHGPTLIKQILWINKNSLRGWWSKTDLNNGIFTINQKANRMFISFSLKIVSSCRAAPIYPLMLIYIHHSIDWTNIEANISRGIKIPGDFSDSWEIKFVFTWSKTFNLQTF